ncbi:expressed unknown protein [Seminavis robusta]|uniref:Uncharacterized protein n=1 Tax=Seminavis robusta TaxID=568900 RepID=A0A9N8DT29_9STRA|nr:expressed unknown protein [Seminavis robusta]|eukprot:Sro334_g119950.1 n/a (223) ;mRNA; r:74786-75454
MGSSHSSVKEDPHVPEDLASIPPLWQAETEPTNTNSIQFSLSRFDKKLISTHNLPASSSLSVDTRKRKLVLQSGDKILGVAKRSPCGRTFYIFRTEPNYPGQQPATEHLRRNGKNTPLYLHTRVRRQGKQIGVFQLRNKQIFQIRSGPKLSLEKYCTNPETGEDVALWRYWGEKNDVEIFGPSVDVGLVTLLVIITACFDASSNEVVTAVMESISAVVAAVV